MNINFDWLIKAVAPKRYHENLLNKIVYSNYISNGLVAWYDDQNRETYIKKGYQGNLMVYSIIKKITEKVKGSPLYVYEEKPDRKNRLKYKSMKYSSDATERAMSNIFKRKELVYADGSSLSELIKKPNSYQSTSEFINAISGYYYLTGEAFVYGVGPGDDSVDFGKFTELHVLPSHLVQIVSGDWKDPVKGYKLRIGDYNIEIPANQVRHIKMWNPNWDLAGSQLRGQSPLMAGLKFLKKNDAALEAWAKSNQNEGAKGIISPNVNDPKLWPNPEQRKTIDDRVDERINGLGNSGRVITSAMPLRYDAIGLSPVAMAILEGMNYDDEKLCNLWGVNPVLFKPNATNANLEFAMKGLVTDVVIPFLNTLEEELNEFLTPAYNKYGNKFVLDFDTSIYSELRTDNKTIMDLVESGIITHNEGREMMSFDRYEDDAADKLFVNAGKIPIEEAALGMGDLDGEKDFDYSDYN